MQLRHVYWIGGGSGAGKSDVARRLAIMHGFRVYSTDEVMSDHAGRCPPPDCPELARFLEREMDERWLDRSPEVMHETFHWFRGEGFGLIVEDLLSMAAGSEVIVEGFRLLPNLVKPLLADKARAVWLLPSAEFRERAFASRGTTWEIANKTSNPDKALQNLLARDRLFTERLREETRTLDLAAIEVDVTKTEKVLVEEVAGLLGLETAL